MARAPLRIRSTPAGLGPDVTEATGGNGFPSLYRSSSRRTSASSPRPASSLTLYASPSSPCVARTAARALSTSSRGR